MTSSCNRRLASSRACSACCSVSLCQAGNSCSQPVAEGGSISVPRRLLPKVWAVPALGEGAYSYILYQALCLLLWEGVPFLTCLQTRTIP